MTDSIMTLDAYNSGTIMKAGGEAEIVAGLVKPVIDAISDVSKTAIHEAQETKRLQARMKAVIRVYEEYCATVNHICDKYDAEYRIAMKADHKIQKYAMKQMNLMINPYVEQGIDIPENVIVVISDLMKLSMSTANVDAVNSGISSQALLQMTGQMRLPEY